MAQWKIPLTRIEVTEEHEKLGLEIIKSSYWTEGKYVKEFEKKFSEVVGVKHCVACGNGTNALMLVFDILKDKYDRIICPALTFPATLNAALKTGYKVILKDVSDTDPYLLDATGLDSAKPTDLLVPVHLLGYPVKMGPIMELSKKIGFGVVTDSCEATGTAYEYSRVGNMGEIASCFSFYPTHLIQSFGELGCVTTNDDELAIKMRSIKNHGRFGDPLKFNHKYPGFNFKAIDMSAAFALLQLNDLDKIIKTRHKIVKYFNSKIKNKDLILPETKPNLSHLCYSIGVEDKGKKALYTKALNIAGVETRDMFPALHRQEAYQGLVTDYELIEGKVYDFTLSRRLQKDKEGNYRWHNLTFPKASYYEDHFFYITCHQSLTKEECDLIIKILNKKV